MPHWLQRLWNASPRMVWEATARRIQPSRHRPPVPEWCIVQAGPLKGAQLFLAPRAVDTWAQMAAGTFDQFFLDALVEARVLDGAVLWDIGSHFGYHALAFAALSGPQGKVIAFEPNPANQQRIRLHLERNPALARSITLDPSAVSDRNGTASFVFADQLESGLSSGSHLAGITTPHGDYAQFRTTEVPTITIDELVLKRGQPAPDVIKIDVEGAESLVLEGGREFFQRHRPILLIEIHHILQMSKVRDFFEELGYQARVLDEAQASPGRCFVMAWPKVPKALI